MLGSFNHLEIGSTHIHATTFNMASTNGEETQKTFSYDSQDLAYEWTSKHRIEVEHIAYEVLLKKNEMMLKNDVIEIHYNKMK